MRRTAALIVGGGPAGSAAAITLARGGADPLLLERHAEPQDALCGGFVSWRTLERLSALGLDIEALGGEPIDTLALFAESRASEARLPEPGRGVSRRRLDALLLDRAAQAGARIERGVMARSAEGNGIVRLADGDIVVAGALFLATGKHELRGLAREAGDTEGGWMGLRFRLDPTRRLAKALAGRIELHLFTGGYAGLLLQEDGTANLCMAVRRDRLGEAGDRDALLARLADEAPLLGERLAGGEIVARDAIGHVPYGWRATHGTAGLFRIGDQAAVIPSLAGEGIGIALASGERAARAYFAGGRLAGSAFQPAFSARAREPLAIAGVIARLAETSLGAKIVTGLARLPGAARLAARATRIA
ncbi:MAG: FAD-dependent monooxygenase [Sphingomonadales bacterium]|nr:FAD-dependent monooxygenase [Sphingomonadales bacterium]